MAGEYRAPQEAIDNASEDSSLDPSEKETSINFGKRNDHARVFTSETGMMRRILGHPHVPVISVTVEEGDSRPTVDLDDYDGQPIVGVQARAPIGLLKIQQTPRKDNQHARVVSKRARNLQGAD